MGGFKSRWDDFGALVVHAERPSRYIDHEFRAASEDADSTVNGEAADFRFCMVYPDTYELGQANQAVRILVNAVNAIDGMAAERGFLPAPDMCDALRREGVPLCSLESCAPLNAFDAVGITLPHELAATNVLEALDLAGIPVRAAARAQDDPIVVAGGPCAFSPEPYAPFFDAINIGEGEESLPQGLCTIRACRLQGMDRAEILRTLATLPGWYVPSLYRWRSAEEAQQAGSWVEPLCEQAPPVVRKQLFAGFAESPGWEPCIVPFAEVVHDRLNVEVLRGCARGCRFCQAGMMYRPVRERSAENVVESVMAGLVRTGYEEVSLTSLSTTDHSQIANILGRLNRAFTDTGVRVSIPSQRLDAFGADMATLVAGQKKGGLTFAPEAGTQRLRDVINKNVTEDDLMAAIDASFTAGWRRCKLYFMIGLPTETDEDVLGIAHLLDRAYERARAIVPPDQRGAIKISASVALFVPKSHTPFQWDGQIAPEEALRRVDLLRHAVRYRAITVGWHDPKTSFVEAVMSRSGREAAALVEGAWRRGARFDAWTECFNEQAWRDAAAAEGIDVDSVAQTSYPTERIMPWEHISTGASRAWLARERKRAEEECTTPDCTFGDCSGCGACTALGADNMLAQPRTVRSEREDRTDKPPATVQADGGEQRTFRLRATFVERGRLALLSHLEVAHALERMVRRAGLPFAVSQGFSPHMKIAFGSALPVGVGSTCELFDLQLTDYVAPDKVLAALQAASVPDLMVQSCAYIEPRAQAASVAFPFSTYEVRFAQPVDPAAWCVPETVEVVRKRKQKVLQVADFLTEGFVFADDGCSATFTLEAKPTGSLRCDTLLEECLRLTCAGLGDTEPIEVLSITRIAQR